MQILDAPAAQLLKELMDAGVRLRVFKDELQEKGPLDDELRRQIREHKRELMELVQVGEHKWQPQAEWLFSLIEIASQKEPGMMDIWVVGQRIDKEGRKFWFVGSKQVPQTEPQSSLLSESLD